MTTVDKCPPCHLIVSSSFKISPVKPTSRNSCLNTSSPAGATSFPCSLGIPLQGLLGDVYVGFLKVHPIQLHFLHQICNSTGFQLVLFHRFTMLTLPLREMFSIPLSVNECLQPVLWYGLLFFKSLIYTASPAPRWSQRCIF